MKILKTQVLRGPNLWSNHIKNLIQVKIDLEEMEGSSTDKISDFAQRMKAALPSFEERDSSENCHATFSVQLKRGKSLAHVIEYVALEIQSLAGMKTEFGCTRETAVKGIYNTVFSYEIEEAGLFASKAALQIVEAISKNEYYDISVDIEYLIKLRRRYALGPSTKSIVEEATLRGIPWKRLGKKSKIQLGYGKNQKQFQATMTFNTSAVAVNLAGDKDATKKLLIAAAVPVAQGDYCTTFEGMIAIVNKIKFPIVIKPLDGNHGRGVTVNINDYKSAELAFWHAQEFSTYVIIEKYITGDDYRVLVIDGKFIAASLRTPAHIIGDGKSSVRALIETINQHPNRGTGHESVLTKIAADADTFAHLERLGYNYETIPKVDEKIFLKSTANLSTGATAVDVTEKIHPENIFMAQRIAAHIGLDICGIDIIAPNISEPITENNGVVLEVNAAPGFRMHLSPSAGKPRNVAKAVVDMLYPPGSTSTIPIIAITGTNGKTTTTRLIAHIVDSCGYTVGFTTTDGIYIGSHKIKTGDTTGPISADMILKEPTVDFAVLETARGGLIRSGLSFDYCDVGIITNIQEDHIGLNDINNLEDLANVKAVVARSVKKSGWAVLNAEDEHCVKIANKIDCNVVYFALSGENLELLKHFKEGGTIATIQDNHVVIKRNSETILIQSLENIPLTENGKVKFMIANVLAATAALFTFGIPTTQIQQGLKTFLPSYEQTPGRMNLFECNDFKVLVDYAHNPHGMLAMKDYLSTVDSKRKIGIVAGVGDRRNQDIIDLARIAASMFDHIIVRQEHGLRGRTLEEIHDLMVTGIQGAKTSVTYDLIENENDAIRHALKMAKSGDFIVALSEMYEDVIKIIKEFRR